MAWLTKSRFLSGLQCPKRLWSEVHAPIEGGLPDSTVLMNGRAVDDLVRRLKPGAVVSRERGMPAAIAETARLIRAGAPPVLYQPAFRAGALAVMADVLETQGSSVTLTEVKSSTGVKPEHLPDAAFQALVIRRSGLEVDRVLLAHIDRNFELRDRGDYEGLLRHEDLTLEVEACLPEIEEAATRLLSVMASPLHPPIAMGAQCTTPFDCPFIDRCRGPHGTPLYPVGLLPRGGRTVERLRREGYEDLRAVPAERLSGALHQRVHRATLSGEVYFNAAATATLRSLSYPMAYLDFETIGLAVPELLGTHPYEPWPFQWSVHVETSRDAVTHAEYLAVESFGDAGALAEALLASLPDDGPIFAYNAPFERAVLERLCGHLPALSPRLRALIARLVDLLPITRAAYYHRDMKGSWSIKAVLPTIAPDLDYAALGDVQDGDAAQRAFLQIRGGCGAASRRAALRQALLAYCERDTWGLVVLRRFLADGRPATTPALAGG